MNNKPLYKIIEYIFCLFAAVTFAYNLFNAFVVPKEQASNIPLLVLTVVGILLLLNIFFVNRVMTIITLSVVGSLIVIYLVSHRTMSIDAQIAEIIPYLFIIITTGSCLLVYLCAQTRLSIALLFYCCVFVFFYFSIQGYDLSIPAFIILLGSVCILYLTRQFRKDMEITKTRDPLVIEFAGMATVISILVLVVANIAFGILSPSNLPTKTWNMFLPTVNNGQATAGFSDYDSNRLLGGSVNPNNTRMLQVAAPGSFYLKGRTYDTYTGKSWTITQGNELDQTNLVTSDGYWLQFYTYSDNYKLFQTLPDPFDAINQLTGLLPRAYNQYLYQNDVPITVKTATVTVEFPQLRNLFIPVNTIYSAPDFEKFFYAESGDYRFGANMPVGMTYSVNYLDFDFNSASFQQFLTQGNTILDNMSQDTVGKYFATKAKAESAQAKKYYGKPGETVTKRTQNLALSITKSSKTDYEKVMAIKKYLADHYTYTTSPKSMPKDKDFVDYFLFTSKQGYCTHFATAMTVMLRAVGIPARYVEGFVSPPPLEDGVYDVTADQSHAWVEVYFDPFGFCAVDATPGFPQTSRGQGFESDSESSSSDVESASSDSSSEGSSSQPTSSTPSAPVTQKDGQAHTGGGFLYALSYAAAFIVLIVAAFGIKRLLIVLRLRHINRQQPRERILALYEFYLSTLRRFGKGREPEETPYEYAQRISASVDFGSFDFVEITEIFVRARYAAPASLDLGPYEAFEDAFLRLCRQNFHLWRYLMAYLFI